MRYVAAALSALMFTVPFGFALKGGPLMFSSVGMSVFMAGSMIAAAILFVGAWLGGIAQDTAHSSMTLAWLKRDEDRAERRAAARGDDRA